MKFWRKLKPVNSWAYFFLIAITLIPFGQVCTYEFVSLDDPAYISDNPWVQRGLSWENLGRAFRSRDMGFWHPLTWVSLQLDASLFGPQSAWGFHLTNLLLHLANVILLFRIMVRMTGAVRQSVLVAALFAVHPMHVESVAWVTERKDVLSGFFWLVALAAYVHYSQKPSLGRYVAVMVAMALSLMAKPMAVTLPCVLLLIDIWPLRRTAGAPGNEQAISPGPFPHSRSWSWLILEKLPLLALGLGFSALTLWSHRAYMGDVLHMIPLSRRLGHALIFYGWYVKKTFLPFFLGLYYPFPLPHQVWWQATVTGMFLALVTLGAWWWRRHVPALLVGWLWFLGMLFPVIGLLGTGEPVADRWSYLPHIGFFLGLVWGGAALADRFRLRPALRWGLPALLVLFFMGVSWFQTCYWQNSWTLWQHAYEVNGDSYQIHNHLAMCYTKRNDFEKAEFHNIKCLQIDPARMLYRMGFLFFQDGKLAKAEECLQEALRIKPGRPWICGALSLVFVAKKQFGEAIPLLQKKINDTGPDVETCYALGVAYTAIGRAQEGQAAFQHAFSLALDHQTISKLKAKFSLP